MAQTREGAIKIAAKKAGLSVSEYLAKTDAGLKRCTTCKEWKQVAEFATDRSRWDGLKAKCKTCDRSIYDHTYMPKPRVSKKGARFAPIKDGDRRQARGRVNTLIRIGILQDPDDVPCTDCGHTGDDRRHEYDHYLGYAAENQENVQSVCTKCHWTRERSRGRFSHVDNRDNKGRIRRTTNV